MTYSLAKNFRYFTVVYRVQYASCSGILDVQAASSEHAVELLDEVASGAGIECPYVVEHVIAHKVPRVILHVDYGLKQATSDGAVELLEFNDNKDAVAAFLCESDTPPVMPESLTPEGERDPGMCITYCAHQARYLPAPVAFGFEFLSDASRVSSYANRCLGAR